MDLIDYNGKRGWSKEAIQRRYKKLCKVYGVNEPLNLTPVEHVEKNKKWIYPVMEKVISGIAKNDEACKEIGIAFIEEDSKFPFGKILKSNTARELRRTILNEIQKKRIRQRVVTMLIEGNVPHEYKEYSKLLRNVGFSDHWTDIEKSIDRDNQYVMRYYEYYRKFL